MEKMWAIAKYLIRSKRRVRMSSSIRRETMTDPTTGNTSNLLLPELPSGDKKDTER